MAVPTGTYTSYHDAGLREDLSDVISNISPDETVFLSKFAKRKATARYHEWVIDTLASYSDNHQIEGDTFAGAAITAPSRTGNYCQILAKPFIISETDDVVSKAGRKSNVAYYTAKALKELAKDLEYALCFGSGNSGDSATAREMKGVVGNTVATTAAVNGWITTNIACGSADSANVTEANFNAMLAKVWAAGGKPQSAYVNSVQKRAISAYTGNNTRYNDIVDGKVRASVDIYMSDFGPVRVYLQRAFEVIKGATAILQDDLWEVAYLRPPKVQEMAKTNDGVSRQVICEATLVALNQAGNGLIRGQASS